MNQKYQRIFLLYFAGHTIAEVGQLQGMSTNSIYTVLNKFGAEWVADYLKLEHKQRLLELSKEGYNSEDISKKIGWNRWLVIWTLRRLRIAELIRPTRKLIPDTRVLEWRCPICTAAFLASLEEIAVNPDRICPNCVDRRQGDRRTQKRDTNADDAST